MINIIFYITAVFITIPILATWIVYKLSLKIVNHPLKAFHKSITWTTFLYIIVVIFLMKIEFNIQITGYVIGLLLILLTILIYLQWKHTEEILFKKAFRLLWRFSFLLFFFLYCVLVIIGIIRQII